VCWGAEVDVPGYDADERAAGQESGAWGVFWERGPVRGRGDVDVGGQVVAME
jgi:hypothetical protein